MGKIKIIVEREFNTRVRKRSFIISTIITPFLMVGLMMGPLLLAKMDMSQQRTVLVVDESGEIAPKLENGNNIVYTVCNVSADELKKQNNKDIFGILVIGKSVLTESSSNVDLFAYQTSTMDVENTISSQIERVVEEQKLRQHNIENLPQIMEEITTDVRVNAFRIGEDGADEVSSTELSVVLAYIFGFIMYIFVFTYGAMVMQGVIEEKTSRVMEIIVSSVKPFELMLGKIVGIALVALTQFAIWIVLIVVLGTIAMQMFAGDMTAVQQSMAMGGGVPANVNPSVLGAIDLMTNLSYMATLLIGFAVFFIGGYLLYAAMFAAIGSAVSSAEEAQQLQMPVTIPLILAFVVMMNVVLEPHSQIAVWFSMIPLTSPIIMMARLPYGVPTWQIVTSVVLLYGSFLFMVWVASKIYRVGIFMYGKKPSFKELYKWIKYN